jgi:hypothetical protein
VGRHELLDGRQHRLGLGLVSLERGHHQHQRESGPVRQQADRDLRLCGIGGAVVQLRGDCRARRVPGCPVAGVSTGGLAPAGAMLLRGS